MSPIGWRRGRGGSSPDGGDGTRVSGHPTSSNGASSFHLEWVWSGRQPALVEVGATLTVVDRPRVPELHFWALQASFSSSGGRRFGGAHTGLQHHPGHPGGTAVNWGGYGTDGQELWGTESVLPSSRDNPNTRDLPWTTGMPYRLRIHRGRAGWAASVDDLVIRELDVGGDRLSGILVWSEVFAACDAPSSAVRWSDLWGRRPDGEVVRPVAVATRYQSVGDGGCSNTSSDSDPHGAGGVVQRTNVHRTTPPGIRIDL